MGLVPTNEKPTSTRAVNKADRPPTSLDTRRDLADLAELADGCDLPPRAAIVDGVSRIINQRALASLARAMLNSPLGVLSMLARGVRFLEVS